MYIFKFLTTSMLIISVKADTRMEAVQELKQAGYNIVAQI